MKIRYIKYWAFAAVLGMGTVSCEDFLNRPTEDNYNESNFYQNDEQCVQGVNYLYNSPWYDFQRGFIKVGEILSGNVYEGNSPYLNFTVNGTDENLVNMSYSLWAVIGHANTVYTRLKTANASEAVKNQCMGECLAWKAMAYFYLVRSFGAVPIIHDNTDELNSGNYNSKFKVEAADVYEYIIMTLEKAMELLPARGETGRIDRYCAEGLLAKVYLTKSGLSGTRNADDLAKAAEYSKDVINNSGRNLLANYSDVFRLANSALESPETRSDTDTRRKATMMMAGDVYDYFWQDKGGFDYLRFIYDAEYGKGGPNGDYQSPTGANHVKHLYGNNNDHVLGLGVSAGNMYSGLATHILRLSDIYLVYAEAKMGLATSTTDQSALDAFNAVRGRAIPGVTPKTSITWEDVWKERRLELACEGDRWYDYVRLAYYDSQRAINELKAQRRDVYYSLGTTYKAYYENGSWTVNPDETRYNPDAKAPNVTVSSFTLPFPTEDVVFNPNLMKDPVHVDVRSEFSY